MNGEAAEKHAVAHCTADRSPMRLNIDMAIDLLLRTIQGYAVAPGSFAGSAKPCTLTYQAGTGVYACSVMGYTVRSYDFYIRLQHMVRDLSMSICSLVVFRIRLQPLLHRRCMILSRLLSRSIPKSNHAAHTLCAHPSIASSSISIGHV
jgi:hypothetical protein